MDKDINLEQIGKKMPYTIPDNFFENLEEDIIHAVHEESTKHTKRSSKWIIVGIPSIAAIAASVAIFFIVQFHNNDTATINEVEQAFNQLSVDDQEYLVDMYQHDIFLEE